jgi:hypothetical protein
VEDARGQVACAVSILIDLFQVPRKVAAANPVSTMQSNLKHET